MKYISIGNGCSVKYQIDKYKGKEKTLLFDTVSSSMNAVIELLGCDDINSILYFDNIVREINNPYNGNNSRIIIKSLYYFISLHDIPKEYTDSHIYSFIDMCKRRLTRIINYIKSDEKICFIRFDTDTIDDNTINKFIETILKINPKCNFNIVVVNNNKDNQTEIVKSNRCLYIKLNIDTPPNPDWSQTFVWTQSILNWEKIFLDIENNI